MGQDSGRGCEGSSALEQPWGGQVSWSVVVVLGLGGSPGREKGSRGLPSPLSPVAKLRWGVTPSHDLGFADFMVTAGPGPAWSQQGEVLDEAQVAQLVACRQAALAAYCPSQHPKDAISSATALYCV